MRALLAMTLLAVVAACASPVPSPSASPGPSATAPASSTPATPGESGSPTASATPSIALKTAAEARDARFALTIEIAKEQYAADEKIEVRTTFTFLGPEPKVTASGSGSGLVVLLLEQLDGPLDPGGGGQDDCRSYELTRGVPNVVPYVKSGGWSADDPNAAWYNHFFADPALRLPAGVWRLTADLAASLAACSGDWHRLDATVTFEVVG